MPAPVTPASTDATTVQVPGIWKSKFRPPITAAAPNGPITNAPIANPVAVPAVETMKASASVDIRRCRRDAPRAATVASSDLVRSDVCDPTSNTSTSAMPEIASIIVFIGIAAMVFRRVKTAIASSVAVTIWNPDSRTDNRAASRSSRSTSATACPALMRSGFTVASQKYEASPPCRAFSASAGKSLSVTNIGINSKLEPATLKPSSTTLQYGEPASDLSKRAATRIESVPPFPDGGEYANSSPLARPYFSATDRSIRTSTTRAETVSVAGGGHVPSTMSIRSAKSCTEPKKPRRRSSGSDGSTIEGTKVGLRKPRYTGPAASPSVSVDSRWTCSARAIWDSRTNGLSRPLSCTSSAPDPFSSSDTARMPVETLSRNVSVPATHVTATATPTMLISVYATRLLIRAVARRTPAVISVCSRWITRCRPGDQQAVAWDATSRRQKVPASRRPPALRCTQLPQHQSLRPGPANHPVECRRHR